MKRLIRKSSIDPKMLDMDKIREIGQKQMEDSGNTNDPDFDKKCIHFEYQDIRIVDPFTDETGRFEVDPVEYYGEKFLNSDFAKFTKDDIPGWDDIEEIELDAPDRGDYLDKQFTKDHSDEKYW